MQPLITPREMAAIDAAAPEPLAELIERAGWAVARTAREMLPRRYGARVLVIAGKGNNGADGRSAARFLARDGVRCTVVTPEAPAISAPAGAPSGHRFDLVIDAAYGTGFRGHYQPVDVGGIAVLAVDVPSGVDGLTGEAAGSPLAARRTITFAALKPGLVLEPGRTLAGRVTVADIGLDCSQATSWVVQQADLARWPRPGPAAHKWQRAVWVIGGGRGMYGAPALAARGAARSGSSLVTVSVPLASPGTILPGTPIEALQRTLGGAWGSSVVEGLDRFKALVVGPGLPTDPAAGAEVRAVVVGARELPIVLDGGAIDAVIADPSVLANRAIPAVLTPHDGEFTRLTGNPPGPDRVASVRNAASRFGAVIVAKGPTTVVAHPDGRVLVSAAGDQRLATAGSGDVLAGLVGSGLAGGLEPLEAGGLAAELHGQAAGRGFSLGLVAGDLPDLVAAELHSDYLRSDYLRSDYLRSD